MSTNKHKVFISYYHDDGQKYAYYLRSFYGNAIIDKSLHDDIGYLPNGTILNLIRRKNLRDSTVTVVIVGKHTHGRKWIDWEINASLRPYGSRTRNGLVGIFLPRYSRQPFRLTDNLESGYAVRIRWDDLEIKNAFSKVVHTAWKLRDYPDLIDNSRKVRKRDAPIR